MNQNRKATYPPVCEHCINLGDFEDMTLYACEKGSSLAVSYIAVYGHTPGDYGTDFCSDLDTPPESKLPVYHEAWRRFQEYRKEPGN